jgi:hypothetical protein
MSNLIKNYNNEKQHLKYRSTYQGNNYNNSDRRNNKSNYSSSERRSGDERRGFNRQYKEKNANSDILVTINKLVPVLEKFLTKVAVDNKQNAKIQQQKLDTYQRKLNIIENLGKLLIEKISIKITPIQKTKNISPVPEPDLSLKEPDSSLKKHKFLNHSKDQKKKEALDIIIKMRSKGETYEKIAIKLKEEGFKTFSGRGMWHAQTVHRICQSMIK